jgi:hypothetical protein
MRWVLGLFLLAFFVASPLPVEAKLIYQDGIFRVMEMTDFYGKAKGQTQVYLMKIDTHFGLQYLKPKDGGVDLSAMPTCYHHDRSPVGVVMAALKTNANAPPFAVVGMHIGTMAAHAKPGQEVHFFESNPKLIELSLPKKGDPYFTYIQDAKKRGAKVEIFKGKPRETFAKKATKSHYQVIVVEGCLRARLEDVCVEFMTKEGMSLLMDKLSDNGILCYHTSNRYIDMVPILADVAQSLGLAAWLGFDQAPERYEQSPEHFSSYWVMVARKKETLAKLQPPPGYENAIDEAIKTSKHYISKADPFWADAQASGKHIWMDKSKHSLKGLLRIDPLGVRTGHLAGEIAGPIGAYFGAPQLKNQIVNGSYRLAETIAKLRADADVTIEDLQKGWTGEYE